MERLGTGWFGVIADYEGVVVDSTLEVHKEAWRQVAVERNLPIPLGSALNRIKGVRDEVVVTQVLAWTRNQKAAADIAARKEQIYDQLMGSAQPGELPGMRAFLEMLQSNNVPVALASPLPEHRLAPALERLSLSSAFAAVVTAEDNGSAELEVSYMAAAQQLRRPPLRCVVVGDSNRSLEAARELGMKSVAVTGGQPAWNFGGADLVVRGLGQLSFLNMKKLFSQEELVEPSTQWEEEGRRGGDDDDGGFGGEGYGGWGALGDSSVAWPSRSGSASSGGSGDSAATAWEPPARRGWEREREQEREMAFASAREEWRGGDLDEAEQEEVEDTEVVMPPAGAAFWELSR